MIEFNPDGSIRLPAHIEQAKRENAERMLKQRCIRIKREQVSLVPPKKCVLRITLSQAFTESGFVEAIYNYFREKAQVPVKLIKVNDREFEVEIGTDFRRCTDCNALISKYRDFLDGNVIEEMGGCTFEGRSQSFCDEDYFE